MTPPEKVEELIFNKFLEEMIQNLQTKLNNADEDEMASIKLQLQKSLEEMSESELEAIKEATNLENLSSDELLKFMKTALIGGGAAVVLGQMGFGLYLFLTSMIKAFSVALGVTFSFGVYTTATTMMSFIISPVGVFLVLSVVYGIIGLLGQRNFKDTILTAVIVSMHAKVIEYSLEGILRRGNFKKWWIEKLKSQKDDENIVIRNESHLKVLESAIKQSKNNVFIYSGWL